MNIYRNLGGGGDIYVHEWKTDEHYGILAWGGGWGGGGD